MFPKLMENRPLAHRMNLAPTCKDDADETVTFLPSKVRWRGGWSVGMLGKQKLQTQKKVKNKN